MIIVGAFGEGNSNRNSPGNRSSVTVADSTNECSGMEPFGFPKYPNRITVRPAFTPGSAATLPSTR
ncbi:MAG: hypothetical protein HY286_06355 [Planctomycetes bacterium]|nr:hypothetical protein [Planctomycetota bacterium]